MPHVHTSFRSPMPLFALALAATFVASTAFAQPVQRVDPQRVPSLGTPQNTTIPKGVRPPAIDWSIHSLKIEQGVFVRVELRNLSKTSSAAPLVRLTAFKQFPTTQSPPNANGDATGSGGNMSRVLGDIQTPGTSAGDVLNVPAWSIPKEFLECSEITAEVDFKRALPDTNWANNKITIKTKCGAAPATAHYGVVRSIP
ncbi:MAG: hypothetical protein ACRCWJ_14225 [Casimicrobium sp.]